MDRLGDVFDRRDGNGNLGERVSIYMRALRGTLGGTLGERGQLVPLLRSGALLCALFGLLLLGGCTLFNGGSGSSSTKSLSDLGWCDSSQSPRFQDDSTPAQPVITSWSSVKDQLGFTVYLPSSLPSGSCLALAGGSIHDPVYGGHLDVTYLLPGSQGQVPLAFSEAPKRNGMSDTVQCIQSPQDNSTNICIGAIDGTSVTIASRESATQLQSVFSSLQSNVTWLPSGTTIPAATNTPSASPSVSPSASPSTTPHS